MNRRKLLSAGPAAMVLAGAAPAGTGQAASPEAVPSFYSTLDPEQKAAFDRLHAIVKAQAAGTWVEPPHPDAELIAIGHEAAGLSEEYERHIAAYFALPKDSPDLQRVSELADPAYDRLQVLFDQAADVEAKTIRGVAAKAQLLRHELLTSYRVDGEFCARQPGHRTRPELGGQPAERHAGMSGTDISPGADHRWLAKVLAGDRLACGVLDLARKLPADEWDAFVQRCEGAAGSKFGHRADINRGITEVGHE